MKLPCKFQACEEILDYEVYSQHVKTCIFKLVRCPFDCNWEGSIEDVKSHCTADVHPNVTSNRYKEHNFENDLIEVVYDENKKYLFMGQILEGQIIFKMYKMDLSVNHVENDEVYTLTIRSVEHPNGLYKMKMLKVPLIFQFYETPNEYYFAMDLISLQSALKTQTRQFQIRLDVNPQTMNDRILNSLECPVCNIPMVAPIVSCYAGHNLCSDCKSRVGNCPSCRADLSSVVRNIKLEEISAKLLHTCGTECNFQDTGDKIQEHRSNCRT